MKNLFSAFQQKLNDIAQLKSALAVLNWDKDVFMPPKGSGAEESNELSPGERAIVREVWRDVSREEKQHQPVFTQRTHASPRATAAPNS